MPLLRSAISVLLCAGCLAGDPIRLHPENPHYFLFNGKAVPLMTSGEHYGAVINAEFDFVRYLRTLQSYGFNYTRLFPGSYVEKPGESFGILRNDLAPPTSALILPWKRPSGKVDLEQWNPAYFERFRAFLSEAAKRGVVVEISLFSAQYGPMQWNLSPFNRANNTNETSDLDWKDVNTLHNGNILKFQEEYVRKLVQEANPFDNVIWEIQNEPWSDRTVMIDAINPYLPLPARNQYPNSVDFPDEQAMRWESQVAEWIASEEASRPKHHLVAQNYSNFRFPVKGTLPHVSIVNFHYAYPEAV